MNKQTDKPLIKGYLPVRVAFPSDEETFIFVKEHHTGPTLFVCNVPIVPDVRSQLLLKSLFGRYGEVTRVTVIENPRKHSNGETEDHLFHSWTDSFQGPSFLPPVLSNGKFAHVVFETEKHMKRTLKALTKLMSKQKQISDSGQLPRVTIDAIELQTLADESDRQYREEVGDEEVEADDQREQKSCVLALADRYRTSCSVLSRGSLLEECNRVMEEFEQAEEADRRKRESASEEPDEEGFITVQSTSAVGIVVDMDEKPEERRRKGQKRNRKKKTGTGKNELQDFYRFQTKDNRKRNLQDLRRLFEEDLARVKKIKEDHKG